LSPFEQRDFASAVVLPLTENSISKNEHHCHSH
jgi:hypothetical protein